MGPNVSNHDGRTTAALDAIRRVVQALRESSRSAERVVGLSGAQLFVLHALAEAPGPLSLNELADRTRTHQSSVSTVVALLAGRRLVHRAHAKDDGRRLELSLTASGRRLAARAPDAAQDRLIRAIEKLSASRQTMLATVLTELAHAVADTDPIPPMLFEDAPRRRRRRA